MTLHRRQLLQGTAAWAAAAGVGLRSGQQALAVDWITILRDSTPIISGALVVGCTLAGIGPFAPLVSALGNVLLPEVFNATLGANPQDPNRTLKEELKAFVEAKFKEQDRKEIQRKVDAQFSFLSGSYRARQMALMQSEQAYTIKALKPESRKTLLGILSSNEFASSSLVTDCRDLEVEGLPGFIISAQMLLSNLRQMGMLDPEGGHRGAFDEYYEQCKAHVNKHKSSLEGATSEATKANLAACEKLLEFWDEAYNNYDQLTSGDGLPETPDIAALVASGEYDLLPRMNLNYRWWKSDREGPLGIFPEWISTTRHDPYGTGQPGHMCITIERSPIKERRFYNPKTGGGRVNLAEVLKLYVTEYVPTITVANKPTPAFNVPEDYIYAVDKRSNDNFFELDASGRAGGFAPIDPLVASKDDVKNFRVQGMFLDGPLQITLIDKHLPNGKMVFRPRKPGEEA